MDHDVDFSYYADESSIEIGKIKIIMYNNSGIFTVENLYKDIEEIKTESEDMAQLLEDLQA